MPSLSEGYVPVEAIRAVLDAKFDCAGVYSTEHPDLQPLLRMWDEHDRFWKIINGTGDGRGQLWMHFDVADKALCLLGLQMCWYEELRDVYYSVNLERVPNTTRVSEKGRVRCERPGCSGTVTPKLHTVKGRQRFCSEKCRRYMADVRAGRIEQPHRNLHAQYECINGHVKSPETLTKRGDCKECIRERNRDYYKRNRARLLSAQRERDQRKARVAA